MTRQQLKQAVRANLGNRTDKDSVIEVGFDFAIDYAAAAHSFRAARNETSTTLLANERSVILADDFHRLNELRIQDDTVPTCVSLITIYPKRDFLPAHPSVTSTSLGMPKCGYLEGSTVYFDCYADKNYTVLYTYVRKIPKLVVDADSCIVPELDYFLVCWSTAHTLRSIGMFPEAENWNAHAMSYLRKIVIADEQSEATKYVAKEFSDVRQFLGYEPPRNWIGPWIVPGAP